MEKDDLIYAAGFIDGEGCITTVGTQGNLRLTISSTDKCVLEWLQNNFQGRVNNQHLPKNPKHHEAWKWVLSRHNDLLEFLVAIIPYLKLKKSQAEIVVEYLQTYPPLRGRPASEQKKLDFKKTYNQLKYLKTVHN